MAEVRIPFNKPDAAVPCGTCTLCCRNTWVILVPEMGDDPAQYQTVAIEGQSFLARTSDRACVYLGAAGCTIHDRAPYMCRAFDCREQYAQYNRQQRRELVKRGEIDGRVFKRGFELLAG